MRSRRCVCALRKAERVAHSPRLPENTAARTQSTEPSLLLPREPKVTETQALRAVTGVCNCTVLGPLSTATKKGLGLMD